ncbi:ABC transporter permease [Acidiphilium sp.]|uniref:ABC transporter permease n=1 Tax=Acidiphilium sp. TaxID=527 RepID=UPI00258C0845|nr:ABC transporter permease [Acidiphilium sp.]
MSDIVAQTAPRRRRLRLAPLIPAAAAAGAVAVALLLVAATGRPVGIAIAAFWDGIAGSAFAFGASFDRAITLAFVGLGFILAGRAGLTNVGGEGQLAVGGIAATALALHGAGDLPRMLAPALPLVGGAMAGAVWGGVAGILKVRRGTNEVISTLLLSFVALQLVYWCVQSTQLLRKPQTSDSTLPESLDVPDITQLPLLFPDTGSPLHIGLFLVLIAAAAVAVVLTHSTLGLRLRAVGLNALAARRAGINDRGIVVLALTLAGALAGLAGAIMIVGEQYNLKTDFTSGYGFDGIVVGLLARGSVGGVLVFATLLGFLRSGGISMEITAGVPAAAVLICQGLIVITIAGSAILGDRARGSA